MGLPIRELLAAIQHYQQKNSTLTQTAPMGFLEDYEQRLLMDASGKFRVSLYKTLLFIKITEAIKAGTLNLKHSYKYRSLDDYLIDKAAWDTHRDDYPPFRITHVSLSHFWVPIQSLCKGGDYATLVPS
jgi:hypothetical protein